MPRPRQRQSWKQCELRVRRPKRSGSRSSRKTLGVTSCCVPPLRKRSESRKRRRHSLRVHGRHRRHQKPKPGRRGSTNSGHGLCTYLTAHSEVGVAGLLTAAQCTGMRSKRRRRRRSTMPRCRRSTRRWLKMPPVPVGAPELRCGMELDPRSLCGQRSCSAGCKCLANSNSGSSGRRSKLS